MAVCYSSRAVLGLLIYSLPFPPFILTTLLATLALLMVSKLIWVCMVAYAMLLPCSGSLADTVCSLLVV
jgi:hypothetical protein